MECFLNIKSLLLIISILLKNFIPYLPITILISSYFHYFPFYDNKVIDKIIQGEMIANIFNIFFANNNNPLFIGMHLNLEYLSNNYIELYIYLIIIILSIVSIIIIVYNYIKIDKLKEEESQSEISLCYFQKDIVQNSLLFINYSYTFSVFPLIFISKTLPMFEYIFIFSDIFGRFLGLKYFNEYCYKPLVLFRFIFGIYLLFAFDIKDDAIINSIKIIILGLLSGFLTSIGYYVPIKKESEPEKNSLLYYIKSGKYYLIYLLMENSQKKNNNNEEL